MGIPAPLRAIPDPPEALYWRGPASAWRRPALAVVGTRAPTAAGRAVTERLTRAAARRGVVIVSGLAPGIDTVAHEAALAEGAPTIAVVGGGVDTEDGDLARRIVAAGGALVSEQPPGTAATGATRVARDRLQAGLADAVLVGQAGLVGGTLHTVRFAAEQGRPLWCPAPYDAAEASAGLRVLLERPARELPALLPAWRDHAGLAERLGAAPVARVVGDVDAWLATFVP